MGYEVEAVALSWEEGANIIVGQSHFIKTAEDLAEIIAGSVPGAEYGLAFCEASGPCLIRTEGNDERLVAPATGCGRRFCVNLASKETAKTVPDAHFVFSPRCEICRAGQFNT